MDCLFCKMTKGGIPATKVYENDYVLCVLDIHPVNPGHTLIIPKSHSKDILDMDENTMIEVMKAAQKIGKKFIEKLDADGFNIMMNNKLASGQMVFHSHIHVIPRYEGDGFKNWKGTPYMEREAEKIAEKLHD